jgi:outer membrane protein assembly factor BamB/ribosomal protein L7/L12
MSDNGPTSLNCPACGAPLEPDGTSAVVRCKFCGNVSMIPGMLPKQAAAPASALDEIRQLAASGNLVEAIKRYRAIYGADLLEAKNAVDALQAGRMASETVPGMRAPQELTRALEEVQRRLAAGDKIGAIKVYREHYDVSLTRAKYAVEQIEAGKTDQPETGFAALGHQPEPTYQQVPVQAAAPARKSRAGCIIAVLVLTIAGVIAYFALQRGGPLSLNYNNNGPALLIQAGQPATPKIAAAFYNPDKDAYFAGLLDAATGKPAWYAANLTTGDAIDGIAAGSDLIYFASKNTLLAYRESDGSLTWQTQMPDSLGYGKSNLLVTAGRVITGNSDQSIQAYDANTGSLVWDMRLRGYDRTLRLMGGSLVLVEYTDNDNNYGLIFVDQVTGARQRTLTPTCTYNDYTSDIDPDAGFLYDSTANALFIVYDSSYGCVQRLDLASGQTTWESDSQEGYNFMPYGFNPLMTDSSIYFNVSNLLLAVDKSSGKMQTLLDQPDYEMVPLSMAGDKLIVRARRTRGTERYELWGVDPASGKQAWQMTLPNSSPVDPPDEMSGLIDDTDAGFTVKVALTGLVVMTFKGQPNQLVIETFNPADGTSLGKKTIALSHISGDFYSIPSVISWQGNLGYLSLDYGFYSLDVVSDTLKFLY